MELYWKVHEGSGPYLLLVHGMLSSGAQWRSNLPALAKVTRPVVVDLWGHGSSPSPEDPARYHPRAYVEMFEDLRVRLGADRWLVCGQSLGAGLTLLYALDHPDRVIAQVFTNSRSALADDEWAAGMRRGVAAKAEAIESGGLAAIEKLSVHPRHARRIPPSERDALVEAAKLLDPRGVARTLRYTTPECRVTGRISENRVPTLLVHGEHETRFGPYREFAERHMPHLEVVSAQAGHAVNIAASEVFNAAVVDFVGRHYTQ